MFAKANFGELKAHQFLLDAYCRKLKGEDLKKLAYSIGAQLGVVKDERRQEILKQSFLLGQLSALRNCKKNLKVTAIDAGLKNLSIAKLEWPKHKLKPILTGWEKFPLETKFWFGTEREMTLNPVDTSSLVYELSEYLLKDKSDIPDLFTIERQRTRSMGSSSVLESVLKSNVIEHILFSNLKNNSLYAQKTGASDMTYFVEPADPMRMVKFWLTRTEGFLQEEDNNANAKKKAKSDNKMNRIVLVKNIINQALESNFYSDDSIYDLVDLSDDMTQLLKSTPKKRSTNKAFSLFDMLKLEVKQAGKRKDDDLADSFLHGLAWIQWLKEYEKVIEVLKVMPNVQP